MLNPSSICRITIGFGGIVSLLAFKDVGFDINFIKFDDNLDHNKGDLVISTKFFDF